MIIDDQREFLVETLIYILPVKGNRFSAQIAAVWCRYVGSIYKHGRRRSRCLQLFLSHGGHGLLYTLGRLQ